MSSHSQQGSAGMLEDLGGADQWSTTTSYRNYDSLPNSPLSLGLGGEPAVPNWQHRSTSRYLTPDFSQLQQDVEQLRHERDGLNRRISTLEDEKLVVEQLLHERDGLTRRVSTLEDEKLVVEIKLETMT